MTATLAPASTVELHLPQGTAARNGSDRRDDVDLKHEKLARLLAECQCEGLLVLNPGNFTWLTSGGCSRCVLDPQELPALYFSATQRWLLASNSESQRLFDEELDGLGFMLKEWPWHWGRNQLLADLLVHRKVACDEPLRDVVFVGDRLREMRRSLTAYEQACARRVGEVVAEALEAACRAAQPGDSERELAGQISLRLYRHGATPVTISVAGDGRLRDYRRHAFTSAPVHKFAVLSCTARKYGLYVSASRTVCFGSVEEQLRKEYLTACKAAATLIASTWPDACLRDMFTALKRVYFLTGYEHEWRLCPQGWISGRAPVEMNFLPDSPALLQPGWLATWAPSVGGAACADSFLVTERGAERLTPMTQWPLVSLRVSGMEVLTPNILEKPPA
jgi:Xaa-Pro aminopeptidase